MENQAGYNPKTDDLVFEQFVPDAVRMATAFDILGVYDLKEAKEDYYWELMATAMSAADPVLKDGDMLKCSEIDLMQYALALFGDVNLKDIAGSEVTVEGEDYFLPFEEKTYDYYIKVIELADKGEGVERYNDGAVIAVMKGDNELVGYRRVDLEATPSDAGFQYQITGITKLNVAE